MNKTIEDFIGNTPLVRLQRLAGAAEKNKNIVLAKLEGNNPAGSVKDRPAMSMIRHAEKRGTHQARRHADRADLRQHRHRARHGGGDPRLPHDADHARAPVGRAAPDHARLRRRDRPHAAEGRHGGGARPRREDGARGQGHHARPVRQPRQPAGPLRDHRAGDLARHRGQDHALRLQHGHHRHHHGLLALLQGEEPEDPDHRLPARGGLADPRHPQVARGLPAEDLRQGARRPRRVRRARPTPRR